jgi:hypothetical protein
MFIINLKLGAYWSFLLIFDTVSHKTNIKLTEVAKKKCKVKLMIKRGVQFFEWPKGKCKFFYGQKGISP